MKNKILVIAVVVYVSYNVSMILQTIKTEKQKREQFEIDTQLNLAAILKARNIVLKKISEGEYTTKPMEQIYNDLEFYTIASLEE